MTPERSEPPPPTWSEFIGNCYSLAIIIVQYYDSCLSQMDFYFSFLKAYLMLIITFYRYSSAYAASHFHFNSRPPLLLLLLPSDLLFSSRLPLYPSIARRCGHRHSQFIKIASSVPGNKKRHQCVSSLFAYWNRFSSFPARVRLSSQTGKCGLWKVVHIFLVSASRAPCTNKF